MVSPHWLSCSAASTPQRCSATLAFKSVSRRTALPSRRALGGAERAAGKAAGLENEPCVTATYRIHGHGDRAVLNERTRQPGHAIHLPPCRAEAIVNRTGERWRARKTADLQDRSALRWLLLSPASENESYGWKRAGSVPLGRSAAPVTPAKNREVTEETSSKEGSRACNERTWDFKLNTETSSPRTSIDGTPGSSADSTGTTWSPSPVTAWSKSYQLSFC